ncbi:MAG: hypothetical protein WBB46_11775, partial [Candidatus Deferrimicrobiaceae bacterium]
MKTISRKGKPVPVFRLLAAFVFLLSVAASNSFAQAPAALPSGVTPQQIEAGKQMLETDAGIPPEIKEQLPQEVKEKLEGKEAEGEVAKEPAAPEGAPSSLPAYDWRKSFYVGGL